MNDRVFSDPEPFDFFPAHDNAPGLLLIHGFTGTPAELRYLGQGLAGEGIGAHGPVLEGHCTRVEDLGRTTWREWLGSVQAKIESLDSIYGPGRFFIGGLSMGALLAIHEFVRRPERYAGLVVMAVPLRLPLTVELALSGYRTLPLRFDMKIPKLGGPDVMDERVRDLLPSYRHHSLRAAASLQELAGKVRREDVPLVKGSVLLMHGRFDITAPPFNVELFKNEAGRARIRSKILKRSGHLIPVDYDRDIVCETVAGFIRSRLAETGG
jgi:carboxylesterase